MRVSFVSFLLFLLIFFLFVSCSVIYIYNVCYCYYSNQNKRWITITCSIMFLLLLNVHMAIESTAACFLIISVCISNDMTNIDFKDYNVSCLMIPVYN